MEVVTGALPSLLPKLADLLVGEYNLQKEAKGGIRFLQTELERIKAALEEISDTPADNLDKQDKIWARDVRELSYDIEDQIDKFTVRCKSKESRLPEQQHGLKKFIDTCHDWLTKPMIRRKFAKGIADIKGRVEEVAKGRDRYKVDGKVAKPVTVDPRLSTPYVKTTELVGIDQARNELTKMMMQGNQVSKQQEKIVSIVGFGGLGKTTLANAVYEDLKTKFPYKAFVSVSQTPDMEKLLSNLLCELCTINVAGINTVIDKLRNFLHEKRYFIVFDDVWDISHWEIIRRALPDDGAGCKIIITTRDVKIAEKIGGAYKMKPLSIHSSRILLYRRIFGNEGKDKCPDEELSKVSDRILDKCAGVPLAIITIASLLASKSRNKLDWYEVCNSIGTGMENNTDVKNMRKVLSLSYYNLPCHLKTCLLYLSVFPEDYEIRKRHLIWMWIAEGFIQCGKQGQSLSEVGESYFNELVNRSMIQPVYDYHGMEIKSCRVHDMVLDLIRSLSNEENFITTLNDEGHISPLQKVRRLSVQNDKVDHCTHDMVLDLIRSLSYEENFITTLNDAGLLSPLQKVLRLSVQNDKVDRCTHGATTSMEQVRSMVVFSSPVNVIPALSRFRVARVLHLENCDLSQGYSLKHIGKLVQLRCLGLRSTKIVELPEEIGNLQFLQMLDISKNKISTLPSTIVQLTQLKCLYIGYDWWGGNLPNRTGGLTSLEELSVLRIEDSSIGTLEELGELKELRVLDIRYELSEGHGGKMVQCLHKLQNIQNLSLHFPNNVYRPRSNLDGWVGPQSLRSLKVAPTFLKLPVWINPSHALNLSILDIWVDKLQPKDLEILGRLPALRDLYIKFEYLVMEECIISGGSFPCLVNCKLLGYFKRLLFGQGAMPRLTRLELKIHNYESLRCTTTVSELGFENLLSLLDLRVYLAMRSLCAKEYALKNMAENHPNHPSISVGRSW